MLEEFGELTFVSAQTPFLVVFHLENPLCYTRLMTSGISKGAFFIIFSTVVCFDGSSVVFVSFWINGIIFLLYRCCYDVICEY